MIIRTLRNFLFRKLCRDVKTTLRRRSTKDFSSNFQRKFDSRPANELRVNNINPTISEHFVPVSQVKQTLLKNNLHFHDGYTCLILGCFLCSNEKSKLYINKVTGFYMCHGCQNHGHWSSLEPFVKDKTKKFESKANIKLVQTNDKWLKVKNHLCSVDKVPDEEMQRLLRSIGLPNLPKEVLIDLNVQVDSKNDDIYFPFSTESTNSLVPGFKILNIDLKEESYPNFEAGGILKIKNGVSQNAILLHRAVDLLALSYQNIEGYDLICLPHGQYSLPQSVLPLLEEYEKLVLWFGSDAVSWENARQFSRKLGEQRCFLVRPTENQESALVAVQLNLDTISIVGKAQKISHSSIITFANLREDIIAELYNSDEIAGVRWNRFPALNSILKGHRRGELTILTGPTGSGKTTFMSEYSLDLAMSKVTTLWGSFEIRNQRLARTMLQQMALAPLLDNLNKFNEWADQFEQIPIYFLTFHGQQSLDIVMEAVTHASYVHDVAHVIIDNVQFMLGMGTSEAGFIDRFYRQDALIGSFRNFATTHNCHVTLVIHPRKEREGEPLTPSSIFGGAKASQEADNVLIIQNKTSSSLKVKKFLQIAKNRFCGDLGMMPLDFERETLSFMPKVKINRNVETSPFP